MLKTMKLYIFFRKDTKNSVRVNLTNYSKSEQTIDILQNNASHPNAISMCLLPDKSIFCYGNRPPSGTALYCTQIALLNSFQMEIRQEIWVVCIMMALFTYLEDVNAYGNALNKAANMNYQLINDIKFVLWMKF
ncbi:unnamed protein product [Blepharisma stoltei]|uniref:Uncharacterized protein n=1 Tax=Blepharisma stoltei TaxID=1481888 RepID=A0AAU9JQW4_9CILI|nr:unnamed protein product [Blepharisma stoltei]